MTTFRFNDLLEGLTNFRKSVILMGMVYYSKETQVKMSKDKEHMAESRREQTQGPHYPLLIQFFDSA